jgi:signal transduction histidine kinase/CheY-like chemotaxis protein/PAS domain-containing protein/HPt (histidine-containing phosphotransfer) domain-containing protein
MVVSSGLFVNNMLVNYLRRDAVNILMQTQIRIIDDLLEPETLMIPIVKDIHDIIMHGGSAEDVLAYYNEISADLYKKEEGFIFDGLHGYFESLGNVYIQAPGWTVPDDYDATERPWYKAAVAAAGKIIITPIYRSLRSGVYQINVACRIFNDSGDPLGVVTMNVLLDNITQFIADMHLVEGGYGFLANENFELVAHHEPEFVTRHMNEIGPAIGQVMEILEKGENFAKVDGYNYQGIRSIFYCERIENGWYLGIMTPSNVYYRDLRILILFLSALGVVLMLAVNFLLKRIDAKKSGLDEALREHRVQIKLMEETHALDERVQFMLDAAPFGATLFDKNYNVVDCNQAILHMVGLAGRKDEYMTRFFDFSPEYQPNGERTENVLREYIDLAFENNGGPFPWTHKKISGELIPCQVTLVQSTYRGQEVTVGYARDLSEELKIQEKTNEAQAAIAQMQRAIEEKNAFAYLSNVLDGLETMIFVTDPDTNEILFINDTMKRHYGIEGDVVGLICYKIFRKNQNEKCVFCPCYQLDNDPDNVVVWEEYNKLTDHIYRNVDRYIDWPNGKIVHLQHSIDISDLRTMTNTLNKRLEQQSLMTSISQSFFLTEDMDVLITDALRMIGEFMGIDQILMHVTEDDGVSFTCKYEWMNPKLKLPTRVGGAFSIGKPVMDIIHRVKKQGLYYVTSNDPEVKKAIAPYRVNFQNYILSCVFLGDELHAVIDFAREGDDSLWDQDKLNMASYVTNVLIGALNKRTAELQLIAAANALDKLLEQQSFMTYLSQSFLSTEDMDVLITEALRMVGEFMGIDQVLILVVAKDNALSFTCNNAWVNPELGLSTRVGLTFSVTKPVEAIIQRIKKQEISYVTSDDPDVKEAIEPYRFELHNYLLAFIFLDDKLYAIIDFATHKEDIRWDQDKINMATYITNILSGALHKRAAELQLIAAKESAEQSNRSKGIFLANMSHEIRTPMNAILGISEIQLQDKTLSSGAEEAFKEIYDSGNLLLNIINDILDFSKIEAGKLEIVPAKYSIPSLLNDAVQLNRLRYESKPIEFKINLDENTPLELFGDELRIKQILNNFLSNAFKYTEKGEIELSVHVEPTVHVEPSVREPGNDNETVILVFRVSDTGQGMRDDQVARLFDEYVRFNMQTNRGVPGTGLGMSITKRFIDMMGGEIFVESEVEKGSVFNVRLPQKKLGSAVCGAELVDSLRNFRFHSVSISKNAQIVHEYMPYGSVLLVDDVASNLYVAKGLLTPYGLRIETAASGKEAIEKIENGSEYDIVFMDHMMPVMDGMETTKIIRGMGYTRPIIALTANAVVGQSEIFLANGFDGFIPKPIDSRELDTILDRFIRDKQPREVIEATWREQRDRETGTTSGPAKNKNDTPRIEKFFVLDAENAIRVIEEVYMNLDTSDSAAIKRYVTAVHGMKSALANIGETELSGAAFRLEQAGNEQNLDVIAEETPAFINALRLLHDKYIPADEDETVELSGDHIVYLRDKLLDIKQACEKYDITTAKDTLGDLQRKTWPHSVNTILDEISVHLLHSAFKKAAAVAERGQSSF